MDSYFVTNGYGSGLMPSRKYGPCNCVKRLYWGANDASRVTSFQIFELSRSADLFPSLKRLQLSRRLTAIHWCH
jgi:hypothetical protein